MKNILMALTLLLGGSLVFPLAQSDEWPYYQPGFDQADEEDDEFDDGFPPEDEPIPGMGGDEIYFPGFNREDDEGSEDFDDEDDESDEFSMPVYDDE